MSGESIEALIKAFQSRAVDAKKITHTTHTKKKKPSFKRLSLDKEIATALETLDIHKLYSHQVTAIKHIRERKNVIIATPTASGKSLIYHIAGIEAILKNPEATILYLAPTRALGTNQLHEFLKILNALPTTPIEAVKYDGDTSSEDRTEIRRRSQPNIILTTPDRLHASFLQHHRSWSYLFRNLTHVIIDEVHVYRGVFGSHVANIFRRLNVVCDQYGSDPTYICATATIANPVEFVDKLTNASPYSIITESGAPVSKRHVLFWNPYVLPQNSSDLSEVTVANETAYSGTKNKDSTMHILHAAKAGFQTICFTNSRLETELLLLYCRDAILEDRNLRELVNKISAYRSGYRLDERNEIEQKLLNHELEAVISTNALELGINIGNLDVCILSGYPGTMCSTWQRAGRTGRSGADALVVYVAAENALNQYLVNNPELFNIHDPTRSVESAVIDPYNKKILIPHLICAAKESSPGKNYPEYFGIESVELVERMVRDGIIEERGGRLVSHVDRHMALNIRSIGQNFKIFHLTEEIGDISAPSVYRECYPGAIYLHNGREFLVNQLDIAESIIRVTEHRSTTWVTRPTIHKKISFSSISQTTSFPSFTLNVGDVYVEERIPGYARVNKYNINQIIEEVEYENPELIPPIRLNTKGVWIEIEDDGISMDTEEIVKGVHGIEHSIISMLPLFVMCDSRDVGGITFHDENRGKVIMAIYDGHEGGIGYANKTFSEYSTILRHTFEAIKQCKCAHGCPFCIMHPSCGTSNKNLDKGASLSVLAFLLNPKEICS